MIQKQNITIKQAQHSISVANIIEWPLCKQTIHLVYRDGFTRKLEGKIPIKEVEVPNSFSVVMDLFVFTFQN